MGFLGRLLKFLRLSDTKAAVPSLTNAGTPAVAVCRQFLGLFKSYGCVLFVQASGVNQAKTYS